MTFSLQGVKSWENVLGTVMQRPELKFRKDNEKTDKNGFGNKPKRYKTLVKTYKELWPRYLRCALALFIKNIFYCTS